MSKHYVVWKGRQTGIFNNWSDCKKQTHGFPGARYKSFETLEAAQEAFNETKPNNYSSNVFAIFSDGGCVGGSRSLIGGTWAWVAVSAPVTKPVLENGVERGGLYSTANLLDSKSGFVGGEITNNLMEYIAAVMALESREVNWSGDFICDSQITIGRLFYNWSTKIGLTAEWVKRGEAAVARLGNVRPIHIDGHPTKAQLAAGTGKRGNVVSKWNALCDKMATEAKALALTVKGVQ